MKLSTRGRYAARAMLDLALNYRQEPVVLSAIARRQQISEQYLEQLVSPLKVAGLTSCSRYCSEICCLLAIALSTTGSCR